MDHDLLDTVHVRRHRTRRGGDVHNGVGDELARAVVRDVATPVAGHEFGADESRVDEHVGPIGVHPEGEHVRVLEQQQVVVASTVVQGALQRVRLRVRDPAEPANSEHSCLLPTQSSAAQSCVASSSVTRATNAAA